MRHFPVFLNLDGARVVLVGGGEQVAQKARLLARTSAGLEIVADRLLPELAGLVARGRLTRTGGAPAADCFAGARLVVIGTGCAALDAVSADLARAAGAIVNVIDRPALSDAIMPAIVDRDPVVVAVGTEGTAPVLARRIRLLLEAALEPGLGRFAALAGALRPAVAARIEPAGRRRFWEWACDAPRRLFADGREAEALRAIEAALDRGAAPARAPGRISVIEAHGAPDLLTLRAVARMQAADLVIHEAGCPAAILELARRDAGRLVLRADEPAPWRRRATAHRAAAEAAAGREVVWLGEAGHGAAALARAGAAFEIVPAAPGSAGPALAEDARTDPDMRCAERDRALEIAAHAH